MLEALKNRKAPQRISLQSFLLPLPGLGCRRPEASRRPRHVNQDSLGNLPSLTRARVNRC
jgi:hypothetical protein